MYESKIKSSVAPKDLVGICISPTVTEIKKGDRIAQMLIERNEDFELVQVDELSETERGTGGFGSTGL